jgi:hypothetical protein
VKGGNVIPPEQIETQNVGAVKKDKNQARKKEIAARMFAIRKDMGEVSEDDQTWRLKFANLLDEAEKCSLKYGEMYDKLEKPWENYEKARKEADDVLLGSVDCIMSKYCHEFEEKQKIVRALGSQIIQVELEYEPYVDKYWKLTLEAYALHKKHNPSAPSYDYDSTSTADEDAQTDVNVTKNIELIDYPTNEKLKNYKYGHQ